MATAEAIAIRQDVDALRRVVDEAVDRLPASDLATLHELVKRTLDEARSFETPRTRAGESGLVPVHPTPEQRKAYFPVTSALSRAASRQEMAEADRGWETAFERGKSYRQTALREVG